ITGTATVTPGHDAMTGLGDAATACAHIAARIAADGTAVPVALVELRGLARFNDFSDRDTGDALLAALARKLEHLAADEFGPSLGLFRMAGARFAIVAPPRTAIERLRLEMRAIAAAVGESLLARQGDYLALRIAVGAVEDAAAVPQSLSVIARRLAAPPALVRAIDIEAAARGEGLSVRFQPQFALADDKAMGAEALVRWQHPRLGDVGGAVLFAAAHSAGLERALSRMVWRRALAAMAAWPARMHGLRVALNLTAADLAEPEMSAELLALAKEAGVAPSRLTVEVTESAIIERLDAAAQVLAELRDAGMHAALDDFGTGYSGLSWLKRLPVDYIKIDSRFVRDAAGDARGRTLLRGVVDLAGALGLGVLAEGVESEAQRDRLRDLGCRWYQGWLRAPALESADLIAFLGDAQRSTVTNR
ncbi:MAG: EAL domain-containing protein, partial [Sphingopyxis sp.]|nr:EAL domain-containing protein [Sphingopyxis sp.]